MKAVVYESYAPDDNFKSILKVKDVNEPKPKPGEVVFKVNASACNYNDIWAMRGQPIQVPMPHISGSDAAGEVIAVGEDVQNFKVGDRVVSHSNMSCRVCDACTDGREYDCNKRTIWGFQTGPFWGAFCEVTHLPEVNVAKIPEGVSYEQAAAASMVGMTSWHMLVTRAKIRPGQTVLIMGGGSGVGMIGIQIAKLYGCTVISTGSPDKLEKIKQIGADFAVDHRKEDWYKEVRQITNKQGVDVVFEHIGQTHWNNEISLLKNGGTLVTTGATTGYDAKTDLRYIFFKGLNILGSTQGTKAGLNQMLYWMGKGKIKAVIDSIHSFENAADAHTRMLSRGAFGKILMKPEN